MGAPVGNNNATKNRLWTLAIQKAIERRSSKKDQLEALIELAENLLQKVDEKDMTAIKELGDRLEGKPMQSVEMNVTRTTANMEDSELARIIREDRSSGTSRKETSKKESDSVH